MLAKRRALIERCREALADFIAPKMCPVCGERGAWVCAWCAAEYEAYDAPWCRRCGLPSCACDDVPEALDVMRSYGPYHGWVRASIRAFKYQGETARGPMLAELMIEPTLDACRELGDDPLLVPVPLHSGRMRQRGYNQATLLAEQLATYLDLPVDEYALRRVRSTRQQVGLSRSERLTNVRGAFASRALSPGSVVLLVDDVQTTSSTLAACAAVLRDAGATAVGAVTIARAADVDADLLSDDDLSGGLGSPDGLPGGPIRRLL